MTARSATTLVLARRPRCAALISRAIANPQAGATTGAGAALVQAREPFEDPFAVGFLDAWPVVFDLYLDPLVECSQSESRARAALPGSR